jgi:cyclase
LTKIISESVSIPVIACGGAGNLNHILEIIKTGKADAVSIASVLHYESFLKFDYESEDFNKEGNTDFLSTGKINKNISITTIKQIKEFLSANKIESRKIN